MPDPAAEPPALADVVRALEGRYPPSWAASWDAVGLVVGDPQAPVRRVHFAVDPTPAVVAEARALGADLLVTHHPLFLHPVHGVPATTTKGRMVHDLVTAGIGLYTAHTNADVADPGVSDALADALGLRDVRPLDPAAGEPLDKLVTFVPQDAAERVLDALAAAGAGELGNYRRCAWTTTGSGTFLPLAAANPTIGRPGRVEVVPETRLEMVLPRNRRAAVLAALRAAHPYEEPAFDVLLAAGLPTGRGLGRVGDLSVPTTLAAFAAAAARALPATAAGVRAAGPADLAVSRVAVCGGAGADLAPAAAAAGAQALLTADLRHHQALETGADTGLALLDAGHWATEWPWLPVAARQLVADLGDTVAATVSTAVTDPWTLSERV